MNKQELIQKWIKVIRAFALMINEEGMGCIDHVYTNHILITDKALHNRAYGFAHGNLDEFGINMASRFTVGSGSFLDAAVSYCIYENAKEIATWIVTKENGEDRQSFTINLNKSIGEGWFIPYYTPDQMKWVDELKGLCVCIVRDPKAEYGIKVASAYPIPSFEQTDELLDLQEELKAEKEAKEA